MAIKQYTNEHPKFTMFDKYKEDKKSLVDSGTADISQKDISLSQKRGFSKLDLDTAKMLSGNPTLTQDELNALKKASKDKEKLEPTGQFKKD